MTKHIAVLMGGLSAEREVSLSSGAAISKALKEKGYRVTEVDVGHDIAARLSELKPDIAFNALHGTYGEDGCIQGVLEFLQIPYTHSGVLASAIAMDKPLAKRLFASEGIKGAEGRIVSRDDIAAGDVIARPYVIKPTNNGSSVGVLIVHEGDALDVNAEYFPEGDEFLVESFIPGLELTVAVMDNKAMGAIEIRPKQGFYNYRNKYTSGMTEYIMPAEIDEAIYKKACDWAEKAHKLLGCRGVSRADFRYDRDGNGGLYILEVNTHPGMTATSLVPKLAAHNGMDFPALADALVKAARLDNAI